MSHSHDHHLASKEKHGVALSSVIAAVFLTFGKLAVGLLTGSLGILSEAIHSGLDLVAAVMTLFAVKFADKPADKDHHYGHGKIENLSAFIETLLLLITCVWIIYEAADRLMGGAHQLEVNAWSFAVIIGSIIIDYSRSRALMKAAKKHNSQALEADALHFSTDIWSSLVVLLGLCASYFGYHSADAIAALGVAFIVIGVCYKLGKKSLDALLDKSPEINLSIFEEVKKAIPEVKELHDIRIRQAGAETFIELNIHLPYESALGEAHRISHQVEKLITERIPRSFVHVHIEPDELED